jgi:ketosteroid isomerase-like protein
LTQFPVAGIIAANQEAGTVSPEHPNAAILRRIYARDREAFYAALAPDYVCHTPGACPVSGDHRGVDGMRRHIEDGQRLSGGTFRVNALGAFLADDQWGMAPVRLTARRGDALLETRAFGIWRFENGRIAEHWECPFDLHAFEAFWRACAALGDG